MTSATPSDLSAESADERVGGESGRTGMAERRRDGFLFPIRITPSSMFAVPPNRPRMS